MPRSGDGLLSAAAPPRRPLTHLLHCADASPQSRPSAPEEANGESIARLAVAQRLKRTTDKDISTNEDNSAGLSYLFVPVSLSNLAVQPHTQSRTPHFSWHTNNTGGLSSRRLCWTCQLLSFSVTDDLFEGSFCYSF